MLKFYAYDKCSTCRKTEAFLKAQKLVFRKIDITQTAPNQKELQLALALGYPLQKLFNTSGVLYRSMQIKDKLKSMSEAQAIKLLCAQGLLVKRPFITDGTSVSLGSDEEILRKIWCSSPS